MTTHSATLYLDRLDAVIFDCDGVVTDTAGLHANTWQATLDGFFERHAARHNLTIQPFDPVDEYRRYLDATVPLPGLRALLSARGLSLPEEADEGDSLSSLAAEKIQRYLEEIEAHDVMAFPSTLALLRELKRRAVRTAVVSSSRHCEQVLRAVGALELFDVRVDGNDRVKLGLPGKPDPSMFTEAVRRLGVSAARCAVIEDALAGVEAGRRGGLGVVIGVDREGTFDGEMYERGANVVVRSLGDVRLAGKDPAPPEGAVAAV